MDLIGPLPPSERKLYCLTIVDKFTRWPEVIPIPNMTALTVARAFIDGWVARFGVPAKITTDCGRQFESELFNTLVKRLGITHLRTTPYHPQSNGQIERVHRQLKAAIMCQQNPRWTEALPIVLLGLRTSWREDLDATTAELTYGTTLRLPGEFFEETEDRKPIQLTEFVANLKADMAKIRPRLPSNHSKPCTFVQKELKTCSHVFVRVGAIKPPLTQPYDGPYRVIKRKGKVFIVDINGKHNPISVDRLKAAFTDSEDQTGQPGEVRTPTEEEPAHYKTRYGRSVKVPRKLKKKYRGE
uniref:Putative gypsy-29-i nvi n=1 Tax=Anopheles marajoara TaxID=58244 RepID=A0A2M4BVJ0_9DIPT